MKGFNSLAEYGGTVFIVLGTMIGLHLVGILFPALALVVAVIVGFCLIKSFTIVKEGSSKTILFWGSGKFYKSVLTKKGFKLDRDWNLKKLEEGESGLSIWWGFDLGGLHWIGLWPFFGVETRKLKYVKALPDGGSIPREEERNYLLTGTQYPYALPFKGMEDKNKVPLSGQMTMSAMIVNPYKALFLVADWYDALVMRVLPKVREYIAEHTYDDIINNPKVQLDVDVFRMLNEVPEGATDPRSIVEILEADYGIRLIALEAVNIDPREDLRDLTLAVTKAKLQADVESIEIGGPRRRIAQDDLDFIQQKLGHSDDEFKKYLAEHPEVLKEVRADAFTLVSNDRAGSGFRLVRVSDAKGEALEDVASMAIAGYTAAKMEAGHSSKEGDDKEKGGKKKKVKHMSDEEVDDELDNE